MESDIALIRSYDERIRSIEKQLDPLAKKTFERDYKLLKSVPGIGRILALTILFEIDTIKRFPAVKDFVSYCRLVRGSVASAGKIKGLTGAKMGNAYLRWAFGQVAILAQRTHPLLRTYGQMVKSQHGKFKGNAILSNKIARAVYFMLQKGTIFDVEELIATSI